MHLLMKNVLFPVHFFQYTRLTSLDSNTLRHLLHGVRTQPAVPIYIEAVEPSNALSNQTELLLTPQPSSTSGFILPIILPSSLVVLASNITASRVVSSMLSTIIETVADTVLHRKQVLYCVVVLKVKFFIYSHVFLFLCTDDVVCSKFCSHTCTFCGSRTNSTLIGTST